MFLVDTHCHLNLLDLAPDHHDLSEIISRAQQAGVKHIINVAVDLKNFPNVLNTANQYPFISASVGLHPNNQDEEADEDELIRLGSTKKVIAIGETGLDYYRSSGDLAWQRERFRVHIAAAKKLKKPLIIHTRQAIDDTLNILKEEGATNIGGVMHCFTENWDAAKKALDLGFYISFSGIVTFKNARTIQEAATQVPLTRMLVETDAPYLAPEPYRGKPNEPSYTRYTAEFLAALKKVDLESFAQQTTENFSNLFGVNLGVEKNV